MTGPRPILSLPGFHSNIAQIWRPRPWTSGTPWPPRQPRCSGGLLTRIHPASQNCRQFSDILISDPGPKYGNECQ